MKNPSFRAQIVAAHGTHYVALDTEKKCWQATSRGKKNQAAVGDWVSLIENAPAQAVIDSIAPRQTLLYRSDQFKSKLFAANLSQVVFVVAAEPEFADDTLSRALVAVRAAGLKAIIVLNKIDLPLAQKARQRLQIYQGLVETMLELAVRPSTAQSLSSIEILRPYLLNQHTLVLGQSGVGKSSLISALLPNLNLHTREISQALNSGKHTTTSTNLYALDVTSSIMDSPGFSEFGLHHVKQAELAQAFAEFAPHLGGCKFYNCTHLHEPSCTVLSAVKAGEITTHRHALYAQLVHEAAQTKEGY